MRRYGVAMARLRHQPAEQGRRAAGDRLSPAKDSASEGRKRSCHSQQLSKLALRDRVNYSGQWSGGSCTRG